MRWKVALAVVALAWSSQAGASSLDEEWMDLVKQCEATPSTCGTLLNWFEANMNELAKSSGAPASSPSLATPSGSGAAAAMESSGWSAEAQAGVWWLVSAQNSSGSWGQPWFEEFKPTTEVRDTTTALDAILLTGMPIASLAFAWLDTQELHSFDHLARATASRASDDLNVGADLSTLAVARRPAISDTGLPNYPGGGWGAAGGFESDALDTALVLDAFAADGQTSGMTEPVAFLLACQNGDGGFGVRPGEESNLLVTLHAILALGKFQGVSGVPAAIQEGADFIIAHQNGTGAVGASPGGETVQATALAMRILEFAGRETESALAESALVDEQLPNGSWNDDPYDTGLAVIALPEPDATLQLLIGATFIAILGRSRRRCPMRAGR